MKQFRFYFLLSIMKTYILISLKNLLTIVILDIEFIIIIYNIMNSNSLKIELSCKSEFLFLNKVTHGITAT